ncbi:hypothetical protein AB0G35_19815 [Streptomyces sp. NPDC021749]|uniref:hypothetical protein n=1 Tax=Streptomyces sp. NPDC021749 TaxID=3154905 RepID=UPI003410EC09
MPSYGPRHGGAARARERGEQADQQAGVTVLLLTGGLLAHPRGRTGLPPACAPEQR